MLTSISKVMDLKYDKDPDMVPVNEFFEKPVQAEALLKAVKKLLQ